MLEEKLKEFFGYNEFRAYQKEIVQAVLDKKDVVAILPTGAGKSLCYQLPAMLIPGTAVVVSPLISLMQDQVTSLYKNGIPAAFINSSLHFQDLQEALNNISSYKLLYVAPERLTDPQFLTKLKECQISFFVIDEAHCISQWGHSFRSEYRKLSLLKQHFPESPVMALTATATPDVQKDMIAQLAMSKPVIIKGSFDRPNLTIHIHSKIDQDQQLLDYLAQHKNQSGIIYSSTRKTVDETYEMLKGMGISVGKYHAGMSDKDRSVSQHAFLHDEVTLMVATVAFGMGIHKPDIRFIVHMNMPRTIEQYYQEIGRAGRDGLPADCLMFYAMKDLMVYKHFDDQIEDLLIRDQMKIKTNKIYQLCNSVDCRRSSLLRYFGESYGKTCCNSCDNCMVEEANRVDGTVMAQKIISCVYRLNERFGVRTVIDVLKGAKTKAVMSRGLETLSTYGLLSDISEEEIRYHIDSLIQLGILKISEGEYPLLQCSDLAKDVVKGRSPVFYKKKTFDKPKRSERKQTSLQYNEKLYEALKMLRTDCAREEGVPPYVVFSDRAMQEMAVYFPQNEAEFSKINGVGPIKWMKYGEKFLKLIRSFGPRMAFRERVNASVERLGSVEETFRLFQSGMDVDEIARVRQLSKGTVYTHLADEIERGSDVELGRLVSQDKQDLILDVVAKLGGEKLKPLKEALPEEISYDEIRLVLAHYKSKHPLIQKTK